ncbi:MAG: twin-arginine translocase TatA/TatE family subunit [Psychrobium sp.]|nr:twin-arginine translocase TatA/TatE family subunit [Psychrobium sp.]
MGNMGIWQLLVVVALVVLLFGTKKLRNLGSDLGASVKGFKKAMNNDETITEDKPKEPLDSLTASKENQTEKDQDKA